MSNALPSQSLVWSVPHGIYAIVPSTQISVVPNILPWLQSLSLYSPIFQLLSGKGTILLKIVEPTRHLLLKLEAESRRNQYLKHIKYLICKWLSTIFSCDRIHKRKQLVYLPCSLVHVPCIVIKEHHSVFAWLEKILQERYNKNKRKLSVRIASSASINMKKANALKHIKWSRMKWSRMKWRKGPSNKFLTCYKEQRVPLT